MVDFAAARRMMVDGQVRTSDVSDLRIIAAMLNIPRERFVPAEQAAVAYLDRDVMVTGSSTPPRYLLKPMVLAKLIQAAEIEETDRVLDVACATGYSSAVLAHLAGSVVALEEDTGLAQTAGRLFKQLGIEHTSVAVGPLSAGSPAGAPYDAIVLNGAFEVVPRTLLAQLKNGGRLVGITGAGPDGKAVVFRSVNDTFSSRPIFDATAPLLPGFVAPAAFVF